MGKIVSFTNNKWGVGKTSTAINLWNVLADLNYRVLFVDLDQQCNLSQAMLWDDFNGSVSQSWELFNFDSKIKIHEIVKKIDDYKSIIPGRLDDVFLLENELENIHFLIQKTIKPGLKKIKETDLKDNSFINEIEEKIEKTVLRKKEWITILKKRLSEVRKDYDYIFIDLPPSVSRIPKNAWVASDYLLIPVSDIFSTKWTVWLIKRMVEIKKYYNQELKFCFFFNKTPVSSNAYGKDFLSKAFKEDIIKQVANWIMKNEFLRESSVIFNSYVRNSNDIEKSYWSWQSILDFKKSAVLWDYRWLSEEFLTKII